MIMNKIMRNTTIDNLYLHLYKFLKLFKGVNLLNQRIETFFPPKILRTDFQSIF